MQNKIAPLHNLPLRADNGRPRFRFVRASVSTLFVSPFLLVARCG